MKRPSSPSHSDLEWMQAYLQDDPGAFEKIYAAYSDAVYGYLVKRVSVEAERDDLFQKIWLKFHRSRTKWSSDYPILQWIFVISRSVLLDRYRETASSPFGHLSGDDSVLERLPAEKEPPSEDSESEERSELEKEMVSQGLSADQIRVIREHVFQEEDYEDIAKRLGKSAVSVRKIFSRGMERLKKADFLLSKISSKKRANHER